MTKKLPAKLLSVILTIAICATTVFGCLITVNAAETPSYVITGAQCQKGDAAATATACFTVPDGMASGVFTIDNTNNWYSSVEVAIDSGTPVEGEYNADDFSIDVLNGNVVFNITDSDGSAKLYTTVTLKLNFVFAAGITEDIDITISGLDFSGRYDDENYTEFTATNGKFLAGCSHAYEVSGDPVYADTTNGYTVYSAAACALCGETKDGYQVVPKAEDDSDNGVVVYANGPSTAAAVELYDSANSVNSEENPYIIKYAEQLHALARGVLKNSNGELVSGDGAYFKVADGIKAFVMQKSDAKTVMSLSSSDEVYNYFKDGGTTTYWGIANADYEVFSGHFDGNGVEIYGLWTGGNSTALFQKVSGDSSFKNFAVKNSYITASSWAGVAAVVGQTVSDSVVDTVTIENITVANNYIAQNYAGSASDTHVNGASAIMGACMANGDYKDYAKINNCLIYGNTLDNSVITAASKTPDTGLISYGGYNAEQLITNVISIDVTPWTLNTGGWYLKTISAFKNVYTNMDTTGLANFDAGNNWTNINANLDVASLQGATAATTADKLSWNSESNTAGVWFVGKSGEYPSLLKGFEVTAADSTAYDWSLLAVNIEYADDGSFALNFHYTPPYETQNTALYVPTSTEADKGKFIKLTTATESSFVADGTLPEGTVMFSVKNLSARDIDILWLPTIVTLSEDGSEILYSKTEQLSVEDYAIKVISGDAVYANSTTDEQKSLDKDIAAALINYGYAADKALNVNGITDEEYGTTSTYTGTPDTSLDGSGTKEDPYKITTADEFAAVAQARVSTVDTEGNPYYFKVEGVSTFVMQKQDIEKIIGFETADEVKTYFEGKTTSQACRWEASGYFQGIFDGNGATVYGIYTGSTLAGNRQYYGGLFPKVDAGAVVKNINIKNSYIAGAGVGGIMAHDGSTAGVITVENCSVTDCYLSCERDDSNYTSFGGVLAGRIYTSVLKANNCLVAENEYVYTYDETYIMPYIGNAPNSIKDADGNILETTDISNMIILDANPLNLLNWYIYYLPDGHVNNIYTDTDVSVFTTKNSANTAAVLAKYNVTTINKEDLQGSDAVSTASALDWNGTWAYGANGEYPSLAKPVENTAKTVISEYDSSVTDTTLDGTGSETDPYIIKTANELAAVALGKITDATADTYFEVDPSVKAFYMHGGVEVAAMETAAEVKAYFEANYGTDSNTWVKSNSGFTGHFNGNGVTVYGLYCYNSGNYVAAGLFPVVTGHSSIKNITLKNSYISANNNDGFAAIVGQTVWVGDGNYNNSVEFENVGVINNYLYQRNGDVTNGASALGGNFFDKNYASVNNCLVYGNEIRNAYTGTDLLSGLFTTNTGIGTGEAADAKIQNVIALGVKPWILKQTGENTYTHTNWYLANISGGVFENIFTDQSVAALQIYNSGNNADTTLASYNVNVINPEDVQGDAAMATASVLKWGTIWYTGAYNDYPSFSKATNLPAALQARYDAMVANLDNYDNYGASTDTYGMYAPSLNLKANPYMAFTFAFHGEYRRNADVSVTFSYGDTAYKTVTAADMINNEGAVRYHLYRLRGEDNLSVIPIKYLGDGIKVTATYNGVTTDFGTYSIEGFALDAYNANKILPSEYYATRAEAASALLFYTQMVNARYGA